MNEVMYEIPSDETISKCIITKEAVEGSAKPLLEYRTDAVKKHSNEINSGGLFMMDGPFLDREEYMSNKYDRHYPAIPLRNVTVFPGMVMHFDVSRKKSVKAVEASMAADELIYLVTQRDSR